MVKTLNTPVNSLHKRQSKDTQILHFLKAVPHMEFSETGIKNISKRFDVSTEYLLQLIQDYKQKGGCNG